MGVDVIASVTRQLMRARDLKRLPMPWGSMMLLLLLLLMLLAPILRVSKHSLNSSLISITSAITEPSTS
jgi:hypothetical protein